MTYEERREIRNQMSQFLADANINQKTIREIIEKIAEEKVEKMVNQYFQDMAGKVIEEKVDRQVNYWRMDQFIQDTIRDAIAKKLIRVEIVELKEKK